MKPIRHIIILVVTLLFTSLPVLADAFTGKITDQDAGGGYITVTSAADQTSKTFQVTAESVIVNADGSPSELLKLIEDTLVKVEAAGKGNVATKITVLPAPAQANP